MTKIDDTLIAALTGAVGAKGIVTEPDALAPYMTDVRNLVTGKSPLVVRPASTGEVARVVKTCRDAGVGIVPQGGNTGYLGGATPSVDNDQVVVSLERMTTVRGIDPDNFTMTVDGGCILADVQAAAEEADRLFPLSLAAEGSCRIGGNLATNAGGTQVLRYGNARDLVLGLEVVLPDGTVWEGLNHLRKNNTGYDLKQLFLGAEGTLGIITGAVLKLYPRPRQRVTSLVAVPDPRAAIRLLGLMRQATGDAVTGFEYIHRACLDLVFAHIADTSDPLADRHDHYVLCELTTPQPGETLALLAESALEQAIGAALVLDGTVAASEGQAQALWRLRETIPEAQKVEGACIKHDISVPVSKMPDFLRDATAASENAIDDVNVAPFGHIGDGNVHFNLCQPSGADGAAFLEHTPAVTRIVHDIAVGMGGSFSAEHGIGSIKRDELARYKSPVELGLMRTLKTALDPAGIMNPGKVV